MASFNARYRDPLLDSATRQTLERRGRELLGLGLIGLAGLFALLLGSYSPDDPGWAASTSVEANNLLGRGGATVAGAMMTILGLASWTIPLILAFWGGRLVLHRGGERLVNRISLAPIAIALTAVHCATLVPGSSWPHAFGLGGLFGDTVLGAVLGMVPVQATTGLKALSILFAGAMLWAMLHVTGADRAEIRAFLRRGLMGLVLGYHGVVRLAGLIARQGARGAAVVMAVGAGAVSGAGTAAASRAARLASRRGEAAQTGHTPAPADDGAMAPGSQPRPAAGGMLGRLLGVGPKPPGNSSLQGRRQVPVLRAQPVLSSAAPGAARASARGPAVADTGRPDLPRDGAPGHGTHSGHAARWHDAAPAPRPAQAAIAPSAAGTAASLLSRLPDLVRRPTAAAAAAARETGPAAPSAVAAPGDAGPELEPEERVRSRIAEAIRARSRGTPVMQISAASPAVRHEPPLARTITSRPAAPVVPRRPAAPAWPAAAASQNTSGQPASGQPMPQAAPMTDPCGGAPTSGPQGEQRAGPPLFRRANAATASQGAGQPLQPTAAGPLAGAPLAQQSPTAGTEARRWTSAVQAPPALPDAAIPATPDEPPRHRGPDPVMAAEAGPSRAPQAEATPATFLRSVFSARKVVQQPDRKPPAPSRRAVAEAQPSLKFDDEVASYELPPLSLLTSPDSITRHHLPDEALEENARMLENVLDDYGVKGEIVSVRPGPVVTMYELEPAPGLKASRVIGLADDIARSMSALSARVSTVPGRSVIGIELPNAHREKVVLREILAARDFGDTQMRLPLALGKGIGGDPIVANLARMPHLLIAGTTGSGKSVAINTMILSLLYKLTPEECRLIMIDPKMLELSVYDGIPHLLSPVVTDPKKAVTALKWVVGEMEERYRKMSKMGVRNIEGYNGRVREALARGEMFQRTVQTGFDDETGEPVFETEHIEPRALPFIVVIVDEMADLMMVAGKEIEACIQRLAQMARASGIHLIMATQRPSVDVITGTIKANFPTRISFQVTSKIDSRTILGEMGAEQLLGMGDMLYMAGGGRITRIHGPFVSDEEVEEIVRHLKSFGPPDYVGGVVEGPEDGREADIDAVLGLGDSGGDDALYDQAVAIVAKDRKCSTSYIQRKLGIGYNKAARLVEQMESEGVVSPANHVGKREVLVPEA